MNEFIKLLDSNLEYISHEIIKNTIHIEVKPNRKIATCPYCGKESHRVHSYSAKSFQDLPIQNHKVIVHIKNRKLFCSNQYCSRKTFAETYGFLLPNAKKSKRLDEEILNISFIHYKSTAMYTYENAFKSREVTDKYNLTINKAIICCQAFHARRCLMYYQWAFPHTEFLLCPVETKGINKNNWFTTDYGIERVMGELMRCGSQLKDSISFFRELK